jgi:hypothetical protein
MPGNIYEKQRMEKLEYLYSFYSPLLFIRYSVPDHVPYLGVDETVDHLAFLYNKNGDFLESLLSDDDLLARLKRGLTPEKPAGSSPPEAATTSDAMATTCEADQTIEEALINRAEFANNQMGRFMVSDRFIDATKEQRKNFFLEAFTELTESFQLLETWGSPTTVDAYEDYVEMVGEAVRFGELLDITQVELLGEVLFHEPLEEFFPPPTAAAAKAGDSALPTTLEERSSGDSGGSAPAFESQGTWVTLPSPEKEAPIKKPKIT